MTRIKIMLIVAGVAIGDQNGGAEYFAVQLARHLDKKQFEPLVFIMWQYGSSAEKHWLSILSSEGISTEGLTPARGSIITQLREIYRRLFSTTTAFNPDIIHSHSQRGDVPNILMHFFHPAHPGAIRTIHIDQPWLNRPALDLIFNRIIFPYCFDIEIAISEFVRHKLDSRLLARLLHKKSVLCYNGIDAQTFDLQTTGDTILDLPDQHPCMGVVGRLTRQKGHSDLFKALRSILPFKTVHLWVIGSGPLEAKLRRQAVKEHVDGHIHFMGPRGDVLDLLPQLDLLVSSSLWEGFPTVLLEAMAMGVPVVATDVSGSRELILNGVTGFLVPPKSPPCLAKAILETLNHPDKARKMAEAARQHARTYTIQKAIQDCARIYLGLIQ
jgi:glycosyltransferase involved in cell wall biosynthesis